MSQRPSFAHVRILDGGEFYLPVYDDPANAPQEAGATIIVTGGGGTPYGIYSYDSDASDYVRDVRPAAEVRALAGGTAAGGLSYNSSNENLFVSERVHYEPGHTEIPAGQSDVEYHRIVPPAGDAVTITTVQFRQQGGGSVANCTVDVYDAGAGSELVSVAVGNADRGTYSAADGNVVLVRISNSSGGTVNAAPTVDGYIE